MGVSVRQPDSRARTSLCLFFWRCVLITPLLCAFIAAVVGLVAAGLYIALVVKGFWWVATIAAIALGAWYAGHRTGTWTAAKWKAVDALDALGNTRPVQQSKWATVVLWRGAKALKAKMCPVIELCDIEPDSLDEAPRWA